MSDGRVRDGSGARYGEDGARGGECPVEPSEQARRRAARDHRQRRREERAAQGAWRRSEGTATGELAGLCYLGDEGGQHEHEKGGGDGGAARVAKSGAAEAVEGGCATGRGFRRRIDDEVRDEK